MTIVKYGLLNDLIKSDAVTLEKGATVSSLYAYAKNLGVDEELLQIIKWVRGDEFIDLDTTLKPGDEIHLLPPSSGG